MIGKSKERSLVPSSGIASVQPSPITAATATLSLTNRLRRPNLSTRPGLRRPQPCGSTCPSSGALGFRDLAARFVSTSTLSIANLQPSTDLSLSFWVKLSQLPSADAAVLETTDSNGSQTVLTLNSSGELLFTPYGETANGSTPRYPLPLDRWNHLVLSYGEGGGGAKLYLDGSANGPLDVAGPALTTAVTELTFANFDGLLDELLIHYAALDQAAAERYARPRVLGDVSGLSLGGTITGTISDLPLRQAYLSHLFHFEESGGGAFRDSVGNARIEGCDSTYNCPLSSSSARFGQGSAAFLTPGTGLAITNVASLDKLYLEFLAVAGTGNI